MNEPITPAEADQLIQLAPKATESVILEAAIGRMLATSIMADRALPPYSRAMMDGIAFNSDTLDPASFEIAGLHPAGSPPPEAIPEGQAWEIMTGAIVPEDCDTVVPYEHLSEEKNRIVEDYRPGQYIHPEGTDADDCATLVSARTRVGAPEIAIAASVGQTKLNVTCLPRFGILSTGDEVVHPDIKPKPWQIRRSNGPALAAIIRSLNLPLDFHQHGPDDEGQLATLLDRALESTDILIISGGISRGKKDYIRPLLEARLGAPAFHGVKQRPGRPLAFWAGPPAVFALPGNPVSALATFARYVRPAIERFQGIPE
ncbi:MAG: molybdopterin molybdotransferase MoeA, partial [Verrucomicrobiota bacterium]